MAEPIVSFVMENLGKLLIEETKFLHGVGGELRHIQDGLRWMKGFLKDADARQYEDETIRNWVTDVRELAYEADDVLDTFVIKVHSRRRGGIRNILKRYACILKECVQIHKVGNEIQDIETRISKLKDRIQTFGGRATTEGESSGSTYDRQHQLRRTYSHSVEDDFVGLEKDVEKLVKYLVSEDGDKHYQFVSICGMGGLGKTTLAQKLYNHPNVKGHFDSLVWVCISQQWQAKDILQGILIKLMPEKREEIVKWRDEELMRELCQVLQDRRCLVVLDDIWSTDPWDCIKHAFSVKNIGNKILLTTRNKDVALKIGGNGYLHEPRHLTEDESWELLLRKAFKYRDSTDLKDDKEFEELGKTMVAHCRGLPLAVIVLGGILVTKQTLREWEMVHENIKSCLSKGKGIGQQHGGVSDILALSYNDLPHQLKPCFLYLGKFQEDSDIETEELYQLWMAEGLVSSNDQSEEETMMDVAENYLGELAHRCVVQVEVNEDESMPGRFKWCRLHDLVRDLCLSKGKEDNFLKVRNYDEPAESSSSININTHRLAIYLGEQDVCRYVPPKKETTRHLRSLWLFISDWEYDGRMPQMMKSQFNHFKMLRVLAIERLNTWPSSMKEIRLCVGVDHWKIGRAIGTLIHLRYLSLRSSWFPFFPSSISNLKLLETLDIRIRGSFILWTENVLRKMRQLRHLYLPEFDKGFIVRKLRLDGLSNLETLINFDPALCEVKDLFKLNNLRRLGVQVSKKLEDLPSIINHVTSMPQNRLRYSSFDIIDCSFCSEEEPTLLRQLLGCPRVQELCINGIISILPDSGHFPCSITKLYLCGSELKENPMAMLEKLPDLRHLCLATNAFVGEEIVCSAGGFPQLKSLDLWQLKHLQRWRVDKGALPTLSTLKIVDCEELEMIPDGLKFVTTLQELEIRRMPEEFTKRLRVINGEGGEDLHKVRHVPSILFKATIR